VHRNAFNVTAMQFTPASWRRDPPAPPGLQIDYDVDPVRQAIADSWPRLARRQRGARGVGLAPEYDLARWWPTCWRTCAIKLGAGRRN
jgi:hypothetical protein